MARSETVPQAAAFSVIMNVTEKTEIMPMIPMRGVSAFPGMLLNFDIERAVSVAAMEASMTSGRRIFLLAQREVEVESPELSDLYVIGTICSVRQLLRVPGGGIRALVEGETRARLVTLRSRDPYYVAEVSTIEEVAPTRAGEKKEALLRQTRSLIERYVELAPSVSPELAPTVNTRDEPGYLADYIAQNVYMKHSRKQEILDEPRPLRRLEKLNNMLLDELEVLEIEMQIRAKTRDRMMDHQRENILREQIRTDTLEKVRGSRDT